VVVEEATAVAVVAEDKYKKGKYMSTFIYTLQRKVQELQNTLRSLQEQNSNLRRRARMLSENAPPGPPPTPPTASTENAETLRTYGGLGYGAFVTRPTQAPGQSDNYYDNPLYSGYQIRGVINGVDWPITNYTYVGGLLVPGNGVPTYVSPEVLAEIILLNVMQNPSFNLANFETWNSFWVAIAQALGNVFSNYHSDLLSQASSIMASQEMRNWIKTGWRSAREAGIWVINNNWSF
jgi:hypothetical protein